MIDPRHIGMSQWTDAVNLALASSGPTVRLDDTEWQRWALNVLTLPAVAAFAPPDPRGYSDWQAWAERFVECVPL